MFVNGEQLGCVNPSIPSISDCFWHDLKRSLHVLFLDEGGPAFIVLVLYPILPAPPILKKLLNTDSCDLFLSGSSR